jgi:hypothetical protein
MAQLNDAQLLAFIEQYLPNNDDELITPSILRLVLAQLVDAKVSADVLTKFAQLANPRFTGVPQVPTAPAGTNSDQVASTAFVQATLVAIAAGKNLSELVLPQDVQGGNWYLTSSGFWEARSSFSAKAAPIPGPYWRLVAGFAGQLTTLPVANLSDATDAGRAMLTAPSAMVQRALVNNPRIPAGKYGAHPGFDTEDGPAGSWAWVIQAILTLSSTPLVSTLVSKPTAPTAGQVDDIGDIFSFLPSVDAPSFASHKVAGLPNTTGAEWLSAANSYVQNGRICVRVVGAVPAGGLAVYVGASGSVPDGHVLTNNAAFTANNVVPTVPGALEVDFTVDNASLSPGDTLTFTAKVRGGTAPYQHSVQALNTDTGNVSVLGTAITASYVDTWKVPAGVYLVTDAVTDAVGGSLVSVTRRVLVAAPGSGAGTLLPATRTRLGGVRIGAGLEVNDEGLLSASIQLEADNEWLGTNNFTKGLKLPVGGFIDEAGRLYIRQVDVGQRHFTFGRYYSLAKDSIIQWKPDEFIGQDGNGDVGLARVGPGELEVNTGTAGDKANLSVLDLLVSSIADESFNSFSKLVAYVKKLQASGPSGASSFFDLLGSPYENANLAAALDYVTPSTDSTGSVLWVQGAGQTARGVRGNINRPFNTLADAHNAAYENDTIIVLPGGTTLDSFGRPCYDAYTLITKSVTIHNMPGVVYSGAIDVGRFKGSLPFRVSWYGGTLLNVLSILKQANSTASFFTGQDIRIEGVLGTIHAFAQDTSELYRDKIDLRRIVGRQPAGAAQAILLSGRSDLAQSQDVYLTDCDLESVDSPLIRWKGSDGAGRTTPSKVILRTTGRFVRSDGGDYLVIRPTEPFGVQLQPEDIIIDERSSGSGTSTPAPSAGGTVKSVNNVAPDADGNVTIAVGGPGGTNYTDVQARAAQLNRTAQAGATTVTLTAESATDYGTFSSGVPTIDATNCVVGKCVRFSVGAGASAPSFTKAPSGQPYKFRPENIYLNGVAFSYSLLVCADKIEIVIAED